MALSELNWQNLEPRLEEGLLVFCWFVGCFGCAQPGQDEEVVQCLAHAVFQSVVWVRSCWLTAMSVVGIGIVGSGMGFGCGWLTLLRLSVVGSSFGVVVGFGQEGLGFRRRCFDGAG